MGREWGNHKYIRKEGNRYIYPSDLKKGRKYKDSVTDADGNKQNMRALYSTKQISRNSDHYDKASGERLSADIVRNRRNAANGPKKVSDYEFAKQQGAFSRAMMQREKAAEERQRKRDGSWDRIHGQVTQEAAKKQGVYSRSMMRKQKRASQVSRGSSYVKRMLSR